VRSYLSLGNRIILFFLVLMVLCSIFIVVNSHINQVSEVKKDASGMAQTLIGRAAEMFMVSTRAFNDELEETVNLADRKRVLDDWTRTIFAVDQAVIHDHGATQPRVRLIGDHRLAEKAPMGNVEDIGIKIPFEREALEYFVARKGESFAREEDGFYRLSVPLNGNMHPGCANCHGVTVGKDVVLGTLNAYIPVTESYVNAKREAFNLSLILVGVLVLISFFIFWFVRKKTLPLQEVANCLEEVYKGDYSVRMKYDDNDEIGRVSASLNLMADRLDTMVDVVDQMATGNLSLKVSKVSEKDKLALAVRGMLEKLNKSMVIVKETAEQVSAGSEQLADSSQSLSQGATEQASSLEQITSSMVEIASQSRANAENAEQASRLANDGKKSGELSREKMQEMVRSVSEINDSSREIAKIIKVIDDIAFQTNLLALNAAVEAARAGKHGKGFAVVAEEVRNLAARSAKAAKETAELIENSVKKVEEGTKIADQTSESLVQIITGSAKVADYLAEIAAASNEQAMGVEQINTGLSQVDKVTQSISANAEESAAASQELSAQALKLTEVLANFRLYEEGKSQNSSQEKEQRKPSATPAIKKAVDNDLGRLASVKPRAQISLDDSDFGKY
jgi:methyl-accepting chemotaxis protein